MHDQEQSDKPGGLGGKRAGRLNGSDGGQTQGRLGYQPESLDLGQGHQVGATIDVSIMNVLTKCCDSL